MQPNALKILSAMVCCRSTEDVVTESCDKNSVLQSSMKESFTEEDMMDEEDLEDIINKAGEERRKSRASGGEGSFTMNRAASRTESVSNSMFNFLHSTVLRTGTNSGYPEERVTVDSPISKSRTSNTKGDVTELDDL